ncbi:GTP 3',8-cyclase MoaA [Chromatocurvus halotolerans]|uniref:GTP 3',8-cyclase n=1 Tax=Chromatocurvus halotolerans TaxID=1132028 RepID=A0A4R2KSC7_9GAMM|nr:GTP 3',8-cyclase MoaA [Chromatocurvus halotolerans]TCO77241.1 cyclic pyranopterin monophosphate synthase subunit MoaA [Chromatocurvus halotolerans]
MPVSPSSLVDRFGREVSYLRLSVTDRCDFRCVYCMSEDMRFAPRSEILSLEEIYQVAEAFVALGVRKIRITGGEPLVRNGIMQLVRQLGGMPGLDELVMTTNGSKLSSFAGPLREAGVKRLNISLDSLRPDRFRELTRHGDLHQVIAGIDAACSAGFEGVRLNAVVLRGRNEDEVIDLVQFACDRGIDIAFIEEMPLGSISEHSRALAHISSAELQQIISRRFELEPLGDPAQHAGPARKHRVTGRKSRVGFISPHSNNFCHLCNRVRVTAEGRLLLCLGNEHSVDLREVLRAENAGPATLRSCIDHAINLKPEKHHFTHSDEPDIVRFMSATGG